MNENVLQTKLYIPQVRAQLVERPYLRELLDNGMDRRLTLLTAPAGYGKTTLVVNWVENSGISTAWLTLDNNDNDLGRFFPNLTAALQRIFPTIELEPPEFSYFPQDSPESYLDHLINHIEEQGQNQAEQASIKLLILDDYHVIASDAVHRAVGYLLDHAPYRLHLALLSRTDPPLPISRLRARGEIVELRAGDLRFSHQEATIFLNQVMGLSLTAEQIAALEKRTEGWIAGLHLAALAMQDRQDIDGFVRAFTGSHRFILDYLVDEVFYQQSEPVRDFLLRTSVLERMNADLCEAVTGESKSQAVLELLDRKNLFLVPLDDHRQWFRYHHMFVELLRYNLQQSHPEAVPELYRRASLWHAEHGQSFEAIGYALEAGDYPLAASLMGIAYPALPMRGEIDTLLKWINQIPEEIANQHPNLLMMSAWGYLYRTEMKALKAQLSKVIQALDVDTRPKLFWPDAPTDDIADYYGQVYALRVFVAAYQNDPQEAIQLGTFALSQLPEGSLAGRSAVLAALGDAYRDIGDFHNAVDMYASAIQISDAKGYDIASYVMKMDIARLLVRMGRLADAEAQCRDVLTWGSQRFRLLYPVAQANILLGDILRERNLLDQAQAYISQGLQQCEQGRYQMFLVDGLVAQARTLYALGDLQKAKACMDEAVRIAQETNVEKVITMARSHQVRFWLLPEIGDFDKALDWASQNQELLNLAQTSQREHETLSLLMVSMHQAQQGEDRDLMETVIHKLGLMRARANSDRRFGSMIHILIMQAAAHQLIGSEQQALDSLKLALDFADPAGYLRVFFDGVEILAPLYHKLAREKVNVVVLKRILMGMSDVMSGTSEGRLNALTEREIDVLRLISLGLSNQEISDELFVSINTVKTHITRIYAKLNLNDRTQAIAFGRKQEIL